MVLVPRVVGMIGHGFFGHPEMAHLVAVAPDGQGQESGTSQEGGLRDEGLE